MTRTQIYLDDTQYILAKQYAQQHNTTISKIIRDSLDKHLKTNPKSNINPLSGLVGFIKNDKGFGNIPEHQISKEIDKIVYEV